MSKSVIPEKNRAVKETEDASGSVELYGKKDSAEQRLKSIRGGKNPAYASQYKFFAKRSQLRVWVEKEKYEKFKREAKKNGTSIYKLINRFVDCYIGEENGIEL